MKSIEILQGTNMFSKALRSLEQATSGTKESSRCLAILQIGVDLTCKKLEMLSIAFWNNSQLVRSGMNCHGNFKRQWRDIAVFTRHLVLKVTA